MAKNCINPQCAKEIPTNATFCSFCGAQQVETQSLSEEERMRKEMAEMQNTIQLLKTALANAQQSNDSSSENIQTIENLQKQLDLIQQKNRVLQDSVDTTPPIKENKPFPKTILLVALALLLIVGGILGYTLFYKPYAIDRDAPRFYTFSKSTFLRSSQKAGVDYNKLGTIPYGSELIVYNKGREWTNVKWKNPMTGESLKGYISSDYILNSGDFKIMNDMWGDNESKEIINTAKCRIALLNYFKERGGTHGWQVFSKSKEIKPNTSYYARIADKNSKFTDFAVIIKNTNTEERRCLLFSFDDEETPRLIYEEQAPLSGDIVRITKDSYYNSYNVQYSQSTTVSEITPKAKVTDAPENYFQIYDYSSEHIPHQYLQRLSKEELRVLRNEIFARHGYIFKSHDLNVYFRSKSWYKPQYTNVNHFLNKWEKENIERIKSYE